MIQAVKSQNFTMALRFAGVGAGGFVVDLGATLLLTQGFDVGTDAARLFGLAIAIAFTYVFNRLFTFHSHDPAVLLEAVRYLAVSLAGATINFGGFHLVLFFAAGAGFEATQVLTQITAIVAGSAAAFAFNYAGSCLFAFAK